MPVPYDFSIWVPGFGCLDRMCRHRSLAPYHQLCWHRAIAVRVPQVTRIIHCFCEWLIALIWCPQGSSLMAYVRVFFLRLKTRPTYIYFAFCLSTHPLIGSWFASPSWLLWKRLVWYTDISSRGIHIPFSGPPFIPFGCIYLSKTSGAQGIPGFLVAFFFLFLSTCDWTQGFTLG
jgi:hypothetical protein